MADPFASPCVLVVADRDRIGELVVALSELRQVEVLVSSGGDDTIELFEARMPAVVVLTASLQHGDPRSLIVTLRGMLPRAEVAIVVVGDDAGPIRTALDALDLAPDRFVTRPLSPKALRFAVTGGIDAARIVRGGPAAPRPLRSHAVTPPPARLAPGRTLPALPPLSVPRTASGITRLPVESPGVRAVPVESATPMAVHEAPTAATRAALRARWEALADSIVDGGDEPGDEAATAARPGDAGAAAGGDGAAPATSPIMIKPRRHAIDGTLDAATMSSFAVAAPVGAPVAVPMTAPIAAALIPAWRPQPADMAVLVPAREPTLIIRERRPSDPELLPALARTHTGDGQVVVAARTSSDELWSEAMPIAELVDRESRAEIETQVIGDVRAPLPGLTQGRDDRADRRAGDGPNDGLGPPVVDQPDDELAAVARQLADELAGDPGTPARSQYNDGDDELADEVVLDREAADRDAADDPRDDPATQGNTQIDAIGDRSTAAPAVPGSPQGSTDSRDFARELRAKMSMMARRLFHDDAAEPSLIDHAPRHDHHTQIDLTGLGDELPLGIPDIEARAEQRHELRDAATVAGSSGLWDSQVRERGLADSGALVRGISDAAMLLAKMFAQGATGRISFRRDDVETIIYFDRGRPVFASSNEPRDRMGELLLREGKITASQYERCQAVVAESGRRMGEILVGFGYLKRRELLPAVRRHVEDLVYSLFSWDRGSYRVTLDSQPCAERIRLSRHPAALILEGIRRKLDRPGLERLVGPPSTVLEVPDRERLGGIVNLGDLTPEERTALAAFDGQADLAQVARGSGIDTADVLPLAWGLCVLGLATARRADTDVPDEGTALVGETDLAIDRERVRARWQLVTDADYFALLGVRRDATGFEIRRAYQSARRDFAADCFPGDLRRELARELDDIAHVLDEAFRVLRDDRLRQTYLANLIDD